MSGLDAATVAGSRLHQAYRAAVGRRWPRSRPRRSSLDRPARSNIATMRERMSTVPAGLRPHIKAHKCPELALLQIAAGALGVACATAWEAVVMAEAGIPDVLVANQVVGREQARAPSAAPRAAPG